MWRDVVCGIKVVEVGAVVCGGMLSVVGGCCSVWRDVVCGRWVLLCVEGCCLW